ncbi:hypothetical protein QYE76_066218 [Lolium multiflorum]|uniref:Transposase (putative) gypsy type domain-containing protein n=1 Tax=Lolium multiflorum TaxID=4521 RepID=A0AAD8SB52_LOLMU|nr:hypothetical protein QYE76_066218 [Lolium multiflorum]
MAAEDMEWERSKISNEDMNLLKKLGFTKKENALCFPKEESYPSPPIEYRVSFVDHLIRGLSPPIHEFLRGLVFVYGLQLHQLTPNSILHVSIFITLRECFLGVQPNWALWKRIFCVRRNGSHNAAYNIGGVVICVRSDVEYFDVKFPDSVQGWRKRWLYVHEESSNPVEDNIAPFDGGAKILRCRSWDAEATEAEKLATEALMTRIHELQNTRGKELSGIQIIAYFLRIRVQPLQTRKNPIWRYTGEEDVDRLSKDLPLKDFEKLIRRISSLSKKDSIPSSCRITPYSGANPLPEPLIKEFIRFGTQFVGYRDHANKAEGRTHQAYEVEDPEGDQLIDALSLLEIHGDEAREGLADAEAGLSKFFPYFLPKKEEPDTFTALAKSFNVPEDLGLKLRQEGLKIGVEGTIALIANSQQDVDWDKATHSRTPGGTIVYINHIAIYIRDGDGQLPPVTYGGDHEPPILAVRTSSRDASRRVATPVPSTAAIWLAAPEVPTTPAFVVYKIGGDPSDHQFLPEMPKEIPQGYACTYVPDCGNWALTNQATTSGTPAKAEGTSATELDKQTWLTNYATPTKLPGPAPAVGPELEKQTWLAKYATRES